MAWSTDNIYQNLLKLIRKNQAGGMTATELFYYFNAEQSAYFKDLYGRWQKNNNNKSGVNTGLIQNQPILTELTPFTLNTSLTVTAGIATKPALFAYELGLRLNGVSVDKITHAQIGFVLNNVIDPPSTSDDKYFVVEYANTYKVYPTGATPLELDYLSQPVDIVWGFTLDGSGRQVYNAGTSVQPQWMQNELIEICKRTLTQLGVSFKDRDFAAYGQAAVTTGE